MGGINSLLRSQYEADNPMIRGLFPDAILIIKMKLHHGGEEIQEFSFL